jgi:hypothetical protein
MVCAPGVVFGGIESVGSRFHVLRSLTRFRRYRERRVLFHVLRARTRFRRYYGRLFPFSCFTCPYSFSAVLRASGSVFMYCAPRIVFDGTDVVEPYFLFCAPRIMFGGTEGVRSRFHVLRARTRFRRYRGRRVPFSCFARPDSFSSEPRASGPVVMFCAPGLDFDSTKGVPSYFHVLRFRAPFWRYRGGRVLFSCFALPYSFSAVPRA